MMEPNFKSETTHVVIVFVDENEEKSEEKNVELVPRSWLQLMDNKWFCYYPEESDYKFVKKWVQESKEPDRKNWKQFQVQIFKEAHSHNQGHRRLIQSFVNKNIDSSSLNESTYETNLNPKRDDIADPSEMPVKLTKKETSQALQSIPRFPKNNDAQAEGIHKLNKPIIRSTIRSVSTSSAGSFHNPKKNSKGESLFESDSEETDTDDHNSIEILPTKEKASTPRKENIDSSSDSKQSSASSLVITDKIPPNQFLGKSYKKDVIKMQYKQGVTSNPKKVQKESSESKKPNKYITNDISSIDDTSSTTSNDSSIQKKNNAGSKSVEKSCKNKPTQQSVNRKQLQKCSSCGQSQDGFLQILKAFETKLEGVKRSILYDLNNKTEELKLLIKNANNYDVDEAAKLMEILPPLPTTNLENFLSFEKLLTENEEMLPTLKSFMVINSRLLPNFKAFVNTVMPLIMSKEVQLLYSGFGRETKGEKKNNFSKTITFQTLKEVILQKFPELSLKDFNTYITRWLSNAVDRNGGRQDRRKKQN